MSIFTPTIIILSLILSLVFIIANFKIIFCLIRFIEKKFPVANQKLQQAGEKLSVSGQDIEKIRKQRIIRKILYFFMGIAITILMYFLWRFFVRKFIVLPNISYPFHGGPHFAMAGLLTPNNKKTKLAGIIFIIVGFLLSITNSFIFGGSIRYGVYKNKTYKIIN